MEAAERWSKLRPGLNKRERAKDIAEKYMIIRQCAEADARRHDMLRRCCLKVGRIIRHSKNTAVARLLLPRMF
jgi:hypothetical protein